jgi:hypothetical protein
MPERNIKKADPVMLTSRLISSLWKEAPGEHYRTYPLSSTNYINFLQNVKMSSLLSLKKIFFR